MPGSGSLRLDEDTVVHWAKLSGATQEIDTQFRSPMVDPWLRTVLIFTGLLFHEQGASRCRITRLLEGDGAFKYGRAAEVSPLDLPGVTMACAGANFIRPNWISDRINTLFPYGDGNKSTALYDGIHIRLEVPFYGFPKNTLALRDWNIWGAHKEWVRPKKIWEIEPD